MSEWASPLILMIAFPSRARECAGTRPKKDGRLKISPRQSIKIEGLYQMLSRDSRALSSLKQKTSVKGMVLFIAILNFEKLTCPDFHQFSRGGVGQPIPYRGHSHFRNLCLSDNIFLKE